MVMGHSAGGQLALLMGAKAERRPWLAIAQAPITDLIGADRAKLSDEGDAVRRWIGCTPEENEAVWRQINPVDHPPNTSVLLFHGEHDVDVPLEQSETYARVMKAKGASDDVQKCWTGCDVLVQPLRHRRPRSHVASDDWLVQSQRPCPRRRLALKYRSPDAVRADPVFRLGCLQPSVFSLVVA